MQARIADGHGVGLVVGVMDDKVNTVISVGQANKENGQAITENSLFEIGSITTATNPG